MARADFNMVRFNHEFTSGSPDFVSKPGGLLPAPGNSQAFRVGMNNIRPGVLRTGLNTITIHRFGNDTFFVDWVVVHWRE